MLRLTPYSDALQQLETQFEFLRYTFDKRQKERTKEFFAAKHRQELAMQEARLVRASQHGWDPETLEIIRERGRRKLRRKWSREKRTLYTEQFIPDDLSKSELLLLVALFEGCLTDFYRALVTAEPRRAFAKSGKQESLNLIFADNAADWAAKLFDRVVRQEADRFDHEGFEERTKDLRTRYGLRLSEANVEKVDALIDRRNKISHRWTDRNAVKHVSPQDLVDARRMFRSILESLFKQAAKKYPSHFGQ